MRCPTWPAFHQPVQNSALELAVEQAVLRRNIADWFVNLGRRNQHLLGRQLDFITELEINATDPDTLATSSASTTWPPACAATPSPCCSPGPNRPQVGRPMRLTDVIRAALGEVEDYQRAAVRYVEPATMIGTAAADLAHLLAELIDNALRSHLDQPSTCTAATAARGRGAGTDGYTLAIIDSGLGSPPPRSAGQPPSRRRRIVHDRPLEVPRPLRRREPRRPPRHRDPAHGRAGHNDTALGTTVTVGVPPSPLTDHTHGHADDITHLPPRSRQLRSRPRPLRAPSGEAHRATRPCIAASHHGGSKALADARHARLAERAARRLAISAGTTDPPRLRRPDPEDRAVERAPSPTRARLTLQVQAAGRPRPRSCRPASANTRRKPARRPLSGREMSTTSPSTSREGCNTASTRRAPGRTARTISDDDQTGEGRERHADDDERWATRWWVG